MLRYIGLLLAQIIFQTIIFMASMIASIFLLDSIIKLIGPILFVIIWTVLLLLISLMVLIKSLNLAKIRARRYASRGRFNELLFDAVFFSGTGFVLASFKMLLEVAESVHPTLFWVLTSVFMILIFAWAYVLNKQEKRLNRNRINRWG